MLHVRFVRQGGFLFCFFNGCDHQNLPVSQTPIPKRIYTKAHSLNLSLLGLYPESKGVGDTGMEERERQHYVENRKGPLKMQRSASPPPWPMRHSIGSLHPIAWQCKLRSCTAPWE